MVSRLLQDYHTFGGVHSGQIEEASRTLYSRASRWRRV